MTAQRPNRETLKAWFEQADSLLAEYERYRHSAEYLGAHD